MIKKRLIFLGLTALLLSPTSYAIVLNELTIIKEEGSLNGEIRVDDLSGINQEEIVVRIAPPSLYRQLGLSYDVLLTGLQVDYTIINENEGVVTFIFPYGTVDVFDLLMEIRWPQGRLVRRYSVRLLDNFYASEERIVVSINPVEVTLAEEEGRAQQANIDRINERMRAIQVDTVDGDNWRNIAEAIRQAYLRGESINVEQVMLALRDRNSEHFSGPRSSVLQVGASLRLPDYYDITLRNSREAREIIAAVFKARSTEPLLTLSVTEQETESGKELALREELDKTKREETDLQQQLSLVDAQLEQVERLITLKEEEMAVIQLAAAEREDSKEVFIGWNETTSVEYLNNLEMVIRQRIDTFFAEVRGQPFFWAIIAVIVILLSGLYILIRRMRRLSGRDRASLMRELRRSSMRNKQPQLFGQGAIDNVVKEPADSHPQRIIPKVGGDKPLPDRQQTTETTRVGSFLQDNAKKANLDLARAYINMGDSDRARPLLEEVIKEGSAEEQRQAKELLNQVGS